MKTDRATPHFLKNPIVVELAKAGNQKGNLSEIQIFPEGPNLTAIDGRAFKLSDPEALIASFNAKGREALIDYDHLSAFGPDEGGNSKAAGWIQSLQLRDGQVWASVQWTDAAAAAIGHGEYRYISPEFTIDGKTKEVAGLQAAALVNRPAFQMTALASRQNHQLMSEEPPMENIATALGLNADADEAAILAAIEKQNSVHQTELAAARARAQVPSIDEFMPRADYDRVLARAHTLEGELDDLKGAAFKQKVTAAIEQAVKDGKITPATKGHYVALASDENALEKVLTAIGASPKVLQPSGIHGQPDDDVTVLTAEEKDMASALGIPEADFAKQRALDDGR